MAVSTTALAVASRDKEQRSAAAEGGSPPRRRHAARRLREPNRPPPDGSQAALSIPIPGHAYRLEEHRAVSLCAISDSVEFTQELCRASWELGKVDDFELA